MLLERLIRFVEGSSITRHEEVLFYIIVDMMDRSGLDEAWVAIDKQTKEEILKAWLDIITKAF